ncbi:MAG TPA: MFS transporter, partial [Burkholderiaceae bacterium]|nr:MFS transporter [Burkholderiaceae bacterium]
TATSVTGALLFNFTTNGNGQLLAQRFRGVIEDPALLGTLLAVVYAIASLAQVIVGRLVDRFAIKPFFFVIALAQIPSLALAAYTQGWWLFVCLVSVMVFIFGAIPFIDVMIVRYVDDGARSRVAGMRLAVSLGFSSLAVWLLGPLVKGLGFGVLFAALAALAACTATLVCLLPAEPADGGTVPT